MLMPKLLPLIVRNLLLFVTTPLMIPVIFAVLAHGAGVELTEVALGDPVLWGLSFMAWLFIATPVSMFCEMIVNAAQRAPEERT